MIVNYDSNFDLLYLQLEAKITSTENRRVSDDIVLDIDADGKIVGIEILDASKNVHLKNLLPINYEVKKAS